MKYRSEIDGLRSLAVIPVVLFHAGFRLFHGGFIGVDVFFVISGFLITSIILEDLHKGKFSIVAFYDRRARRILPALFTVMIVSSFVACTWMLPDELKNYGESLVATTLFSNNMLLAHTSGYWSLASEFKPLLHTWSLGVEEQYYVVYPLLLFLCWRFFRRRLLWQIGSLAILSYIASLVSATRFPDACFYSLPTRAWEIFSGSLAALYYSQTKAENLGGSKAKVLSALGVMLIISSVFIAPGGTSSAQHYLIAPVVGSVLVVLFASPANLAGKLLGSKLMVGVGLVSYSWYLWHQPFFSFARIYSKTPPSTSLYLVLILGSLATAFLSWKYVERPFRDRGRISRRAVFSLSGAVAAAIIAFGLYLDHSYGMLARMYDPHVAPISVMDKRIYNERVFTYEKDKFSSRGKLRVLVLGNSFGRDFVNMTLETFNTANLEIVYRHDFAQCVYPFRSDRERALYSEADIVVIGSWDPKSGCVQRDVKYYEDHHKRVLLHRYEELWL